MSPIQQITLRVLVGRKDRAKLKLMELTAFIGCEPSLIAQLPPSVDMAQYRKKFPAYCLSLARIASTTSGSAKVDRSPN